MNAQSPLVRRHTTRHRVCAASLAAGLATVCLGCANDRSPGPWAGTVDTLETGTVVVRNPAMGLWGGTSPWRLTVQSRIGALEAGPAAFGHIVDLALDDLGRIWVLERQAKEIRVFTAAGRFVRRVGGRGQGPGEFEDPIGLTKGPGGHMWVMDPANARISVFDTTGAFVTGHRREGAGYLWRWRGGFDRAGRYYDAVFTGESMALLRYDPYGAERDTFPIPENPAEQEPFVLKDSQGRSRIVVSVPFAAGTRWTLDAEGHFWYTPQSPYRIYKLSPGHDTLAVIERAYEPVTVTAADRDSAVAELKWFTDQGGRVDPGRIPSRKPAVEDFFVDRLGYVWVMPYLPHGVDPGAYDLFEPGGRYLGRLSLPLRLERWPQPIVGADRIYGVYRDELDVEYIVVMRLDRASS